VKGRGAWLTDSEWGWEKRVVGILKTAPMTINNIPDDNYSIIKAHGGINGRFTVN
jgi:hypothetical protein